MKKVIITAYQTVRYMQEVEMSNDDYKKVTGEIKIDDWEINEIIETYLDFHNIYDADEIDDATVEEVK